MSQDPSLPLCAAPTLCFLLLPAFRPSLDEGCGQKTEAAEGRRQTTQRRKLGDGLYVGENLAHG